jgi:hypothetical protein
VRWLEEGPAAGSLDENEVDEAEDWEGISLGKGWSAWLLAYRANEAGTARSFPSARVVDAIDMVDDVASFVPNKMILLQNATTRKPRLSP